MLTTEQTEIIEAAQEANPYYFKVLIEMMRVMIPRRDKYAGDQHPYFNFVDMAHRTGSTMEQVFRYYMSIKESRLSASKDDFDDEKYNDTLVDLCNYTVLFAGWFLNGLTEETVIIQDHSLTEALKYETIEHGNMLVDYFPLQVIDFDGVMNQYRGWTGRYENYDIMEGIREFLAWLKYNHGIKTIVVVTARPKENLPEVWTWLQDHALDAYVDAVTNTKIPSISYIDDRAITFDGDFDHLRQQVENFKPHWEQSDEN